MKYRKLPVVIDAFLVDVLLIQAANSWNQLPACIRDHYEAGNILFESDGISIRTLEGWMRASKGDFIIKGVNGELYPCKAEIFEKTYEAVNEG